MSWFCDRSLGIQGVWVGLVDVSIEMRRLAVALDGKSMMMMRDLDISVYHYASEYASMEGFSSLMNGYDPYRMTCINVFD